MRSRPETQILLIVEDDVHYAKILADLAHEKGFKVLVATKGIDALELAKQFQPSAVSLDVFLPDMLGWTVLSQLKQNPLTRHIPVQVVTADEDRQHALARGAFSFINKPTTSGGVEDAIERIKDYSAQKRRRLLIVEDNPSEQLSIAELLGHDDIEIETVGSGEHRARCACAQSGRLPRARPEAARHVRLRGAGGDAGGLRRSPMFRWSCSPGGNSRRRKTRPCTGWRAASSSRAWNCRNGCWTKRHCFSIGWLRICHPKNRRMLERLNSSDEDLVGRTVLLVDDDARNIFALSSVLERRGMNVLTATTGREAIDLLEATANVAIVLMDIMMPEMDGYQTIAAIRQNQAFRRLPIVALTAKAMKGDREKCLDAGASDYLAKPVNTEQLLAALRMWLHRVRDRRNRIGQTDTEGMTKRQGQHSAGRRPAGEASELRSDPRAARREPDRGPLGP